MPSPPPPPLLPPPPPPGQHPDPLARRSGWVVAAVAFGLAGVLPSIFFLISAFSDDQTASRTAGSLATWLILIELFVGGLVGLVAWAVSRTPSATARGVATGFVLVAAGAWGLVTGFLGGVAISIERHPTWDDA